jgi:uncharacterized protein
MSKAREGQVVAVIGASPKADRYAYRAMEMLREYGHRPIPVNPAFPEVLGERCYPSITQIPQALNTATLYLRKARSDKIVDQILQAHPQRIIFNPGRKIPSSRRERRRRASKWWKAARL